MKAIEQNKYFQNEFALFLMDDGEKVFWDNFLDNIYEGTDWNEKANWERFIAQTFPFKMSADAYYATY